MAAQLAGARSTSLGSTQTTGAEWTDSGRPTEDRELKHRARRATRLVPAVPELVEILGRHLEQFPPGPAGRLFVNRTGRAGVPVAPPFSSPQSMGVVYRVWDRARRTVLGDDEYDSPLAKRPYDLRHAAVSLWLNAGVPATQVAEWGGPQRQRASSRLCLLHLRTGRVGPTTDRVGPPAAGEPVNAKMLRTWGPRPNFPTSSLTDTRRTPLRTAISRTPARERRRGL